MGVPKFYRWISERYPCLSEIIKEYQIPEFDNLYLDMNGIIHNCSHPNDDDPHFRISEEQILKDIFHYIEVLFRMIQPRKVFFMAIDGVAPRAKMNQQRGRRFRSAREAEENEKKAVEKGEVLPAEARFDSNCITPGTVFMTRLDAQLQYFVTSKISTDKLWQNCTVIYSGHKTAGEGEHKIMEYIRYSRSQPNYDPNTRHCLYGLDADLIMLGLTSHEPHFSLLREEVRFGKQKDTSTKRITTPEETTFHLLHLSLMREYISYEFYDLHDALPFQFNVDNIVDDFVFLGFLVGNDFIPHLPGLHINREALPILYATYKEIMPALDGYLNEGGTLNLKRFEKFMEQLTKYDIEKFQEHSDNMKYIRSKTETREAEERSNTLVAFDFGEDVDENTFGCLEDCDLTEKEVRTRLARLGIEQDPPDITDDEDSDEDDETQFEAEFRQHKRHYYMTKMHLPEVTPEVLRDQVCHYIRGLQWILNYYYNGICSWSWYYPYHYAPYISDIKKFEDFEISFDKAKPFLPFEQLLAVLPPLSVKLLPEEYSKLMLSGSSPIIEYYPKDFETDLNGKQQDWEAVVLIPFIEEKRLLEAMETCNQLLTPEEKGRNSHGPMYIYRYTQEILGEYKAPSYFPSVGVNHASVILLHREEWDMHPTDVVKGLLSEARQDVYYAGFPTLKHIEHTFRIGKESVKIFQQPSRSESVILEVKEKETPSLETVAHSLLGKSVFLAWPHLVEGKVVAVCSANERYILNENGGASYHEQLDKCQKNYFDVQVDDMKSRLHTRWGIDIKKTKVLVFAKQMSGRTYIAGIDGNITLEKYWSDLDQPFPFQTLVQDITVYDPCYKQYKTVHEYFSKGSKVFMLGNPYYGCIGEVMEIDPEHKGRIRVSMISTVEPNLASAISQWKSCAERYRAVPDCASRAGVAPQVFARITGTLLMAPPKQLNPFQTKETAKNRLNIGLNLKSNKKNEEVAGYTRKCHNSSQWLYSELCVSSVKEYLDKFPEIFTLLSKIGIKEDVYQDEVFPDNFRERVPELTKWLKESQFASAQRMTCGSEILDPKVITRISEEVDKVSTLRAKTIRVQVKPHLLYKPNPLQGSIPPDPTVSFKLFDRIINVREGFSVPLGAQGTIIGIQPAEKEADTLYDVLFDQPFTGGLTLAGPSSEHRCYRLYWAAVINITHGQRKAPGTNINKNYTSTVRNDDKYHGLYEYFVKSTNSSYVHSSPVANAVTSFNSTVATRNTYACNADYFLPSFANTTSAPYGLPHNLVPGPQSSSSVGSLVSSGTQNKTQQGHKSEPTPRPVSNVSSHSQNQLLLQALIPNRLRQPFNPSQHLQPVKPSQLPHPVSPSQFPQPVKSTQQSQPLYSSQMPQQNSSGQAAAQHSGGQPATQQNSGDQPAAQQNSESQPAAQQNNGRHVPQPPNPNQLPHPFSFRELAGADQQRNDSGFKKDQRTNSDWQLKNNISNSLVSHPVTSSSGKGFIKNIVSENDVPFVLHGNFFVNWPTIMEKGLKKDHRHHIPCVSYIPKKIGIRTYQIHIYLNVKKLLRDGFRLQLLSEGQILCSANTKGYLPTCYFEKVIDTENGCVMFPKESVPQGVHNSPNTYYNQNTLNRTNDGRQKPFQGDFAGRGRGRAISDMKNAPTNPLKVYENIWNQMQDLNYQHQEPQDSISTLNEGQQQQSSLTSGDNKECRKEVSVSELFQFATKDQSKIVQAPTSGIQNRQQYYSPTKPDSDSYQSRFIPTQVTRNQTPRKAATSTAVSLLNSPPQELFEQSENAAHYVPMTKETTADLSVNRSPSQPSITPSAKPKKQNKRRIAANFTALCNHNDQQPGQ